MFQVVTGAQWADHIGRPVVLKYPGLASWRAPRDAVSYDSPLVLTYTRRHWAIRMGWSRCDKVATCCRCSMFGVVGHDLMRPSSSHFSC